MRILVVFLASIPLFNCAKGYYKFGYHDSYQEVAVKGKDVTVKVAIKDFGLNKSLQKKADKKGIIMRRVSIFNISNKPFEVNYSDFAVVSGGAEYPALSAKEAYKAVKAPFLVYLLYTLIGYPVDGDFSPTFNFEEMRYPVPLGLPLTLANMILGGHYNSKLKAELNEYVWNYAFIPPGKTRAGLVYFKVPGGVYNDLLIRYSQEGTAKSFRIQDVDPDY